MSEIYGLYRLYSWWKMACAALVLVAVAYLCLTDIVTFSIVLGTTLLCVAIWMVARRREEH